MTRARYPASPGDQFHELTLEKFLRDMETGGQIWEVRCSCGVVKEARLAQLVNGAVKSCGAAIHPRKPYSSDPGRTSQRFGAILSELLTDRGAKSLLAKVLGQSPARIFDLCAGRTMPPRPAAINEIADSLELDAEDRRRLHRAAALDTGFEIGDEGISA